MEVDGAPEELQARFASLTQQKEELEKLLTEAEKTSEQQQEQVDGLQAETTRKQAIIRKLQQQIIILHTDVTAFSKDESNPASLYQSLGIPDTIGADGLAARLRERSMDAFLTVEEIDAASTEDCAALKTAMRQMHDAMHAAVRERDTAQRELREYREEAVSLRDLVKAMEAAAKGDESSTGRSRSASTRSSDEEAHALRTELLATKQELEATQQSLDDLRQQLADAEDQQGIMSESLQESRVEVRELRERLDEVTSSQDLSFADELNEVQSWRHLSLDEQRHIINIKNRLVEQHGMIKSDLMDLKLVHADVCQLLQRVIHEACDRERKAVAALSSWFSGSQKRQLLHRLQSRPLEDMFNVKAYRSSY